MMKYNKRGGIIVYVIVFITIISLGFSFLVSEIMKNMIILNYIKKSINLYANYFSSKENLLISYIDDPVYSKLNIDNNIYISRYVDYVKGTIFSGSYYNLSLTDLDNEYLNSLKKIKYFYLFWDNQEKQDDDNCSLNISLVKWNKNNIEDIFVNKNIPQDESNIDPNIKFNYKYKYKLQDSSVYLNLGIYNYSLFIWTESNICDFLIQAYDSEGNMVKIPDKSIEGKIELYDNLTGINFIQNIKQGIYLGDNLYLSNSLYKIINNLK